MHISIITLQPEWTRAMLEGGVIRRAMKRRCVDIEVHDLRRYGLGKSKQLDDAPYGGGGGMVLMAEPIVNAIEDLSRNGPYDEIIYMAPDAPFLTQQMANGLALKRRLLLLCGHYHGIDQRVRDHFITREISVGPYVVSGGELPAVLLADAVTRLVPGVLGDAASALQDTFQGGYERGVPLYTRPATFREHHVPAVLRSGDAAAIDAWRREKRG